MKHLAAVLFVVAALPAQAQDLGPVSPDRPGKDISPRTLATGHAQVALGPGLATPNLEVYFGISGRF